MAVLFLGGLATLAGLAFDSRPAPTIGAMHLQWLLGALGAALLACPWWPGVRLSAAAVAIFAKLSYLLAALAASGAAPPDTAVQVTQLAALAAAGGVLLHEARQEARWNAMLPSRQEG